MRSSSEIKAEIDRYWATPGHSSGSWGRATELMAELQESRAFEDLKSRIAKLEARAEKAEAELARRDAEANRPIGVGDVVVEAGRNPRYHRDEFIVIGAKESDRFSMCKLEGCGWVDRWRLERIGRAARMPDGSPVPEIGGPS